MPKHPDLGCDFPYSFGDGKRVSFASVVVFPPAFHFLLGTPWLACVSSPEHSGTGTPWEGCEDLDRHAITG